MLVFFFFLSSADPNIIGSFSLLIDVDSPPSGGFCGVSHTTGPAFEPFTFSSQNWVDEGSLKYNFKVLACNDQLLFFGIKKWSKEVLD